MSAHGLGRLPLSEHCPGWSAHADVPCRSRPNRMACRRPGHWQAYERWDTRIMTAIPSLPVRGRDDHLALLDAVLDEAQAGRGSVTVIQGGPGMGKTRLLQAAWTQGSARSFRMGRGMADPAGRVVELAPLLEALFDHDPPLLDRMAMSSVHATPEQRFWVLQEIQTLLEQVARAAPVLIVIDDLHWADFRHGRGIAVLAAPTGDIADRLGPHVAIGPRVGNGSVDGRVACRGWGRVFGSQALGWRCGCLHRCGCFVRGA